VKTIWKFPLETTDLQTVRMPSGAVVLTVEAQDARPCLWALVDSEAPKVNRRFAIYGTGHPFGGGDYIGTYQLVGGALVFHVFELTEAEN
jgi:hypothetical protein